MELIVHGFPSKLAALQVSSDRATFGSLAGLDGRRVVPAASSSGPGRYANMRLVVRSASCIDDSGCLAESTSISSPDDHLEPASERRPRTVHHGEVQALPNLPA